MTTSILSVGRLASSVFLRRLFFCATSIALQFEASASFELHVVDDKIARFYGLSVIRANREDGRVFFQVEIARTTTIRRGTMDINVPTSDGDVLMSWNIAEGQVTKASFYVPEQLVKRLSVSIFISDISKTDIDLYSDCYFMDLDGAIPQTGCQTPANVKELPIGEKVNPRANQ